MAWANIRLLEGDRIGNNYPSRAHLGRPRGAITMLDYDLRARARSRTGERSAAAACVGRIANFHYRDLDLPPTHRRRRSDLYTVEVLSAPAPAWFRPQINSFSARKHELGELKCSNSSRRGEGEERKKNTGRPARDIKVSFRLRALESICIYIYMYARRANARKKNERG